MIEIWTDGAAQPTNPGPAGAGAVAYWAGDVLFTVCRYLGETTNNVAEYTAVIDALREAGQYGASEDGVLVYMDSRLVVEQYYGRWKCKSSLLRPLLTELLELADRFESCELEWIPREENEEADELSKLAVTRGR